MQPQKMFNQIEPKNKFHQSQNLGSREKQVAQVLSPVVLQMIGFLFLVRMTVSFVCSDII